MTPCFIWILVSTIFGGLFCTRVQTLFHLGYSQHMCSGSLDLVIFPRVTDQLNSVDFCTSTYSCTF